MCQDIAEHIELRGATVAPHAVANREDPVLGHHCVASCLDPRAEVSHLVAEPDQRSKLSRRGRFDRSRNAVDAARCRRALSAQAPPFVGNCCASPVFDRKSGAFTGSGGPAPSSHHFGACGIAGS